MICVLEPRRFETMLLMLDTKRWAVPLTSVVLLASAGCGSDISTAVSSVAERFYAAVASGNGTAACALLAPPTAHEVLQAGQAPCGTAILKEDIPAAGQVVDEKRFGDQAQVRLRGDTAFLAQFADGWKVVAAACTSRGELPYDCKVKG
jgi:hypothetical protein